MERIPILKVGSFLLVTIQVDMHDRLAMTLQDDLTSMISRCPRAALIDIPPWRWWIPSLGSANIASMSRILDAKMVVVGMRPVVAITLVELGLRFPGAHRAQHGERDGAAAACRWPPRSQPRFRRARDTGGRGRGLRSECGIPSETLRCDRATMW
jgi:rsbT antagonist protein RsbS